MADLWLGKEILVGDEEEIDLEKVWYGSSILDYSHRNTPDLLDFAIGDTLLCDHPYTTTFPKHWLPQVEVADKWELPAVVTKNSKVSSSGGISLCGIFSEIYRLWATIDNSLFLWSFEQRSRDAKCVEYTTGGKADICAVCFANPKPKVFDDNVEYLLVLATLKEIVLVGVNTSRSTDGETSLLPLPDYTVASDGLEVTCITCTDKGRIFLAARDGHIYELLYTMPSSFWGRKKRCCRKLCLTSRWVGPKFGAVDPIIEMVFNSKMSFNNKYRLLYVKTESMKLQLYLLGEEERGDDVLRRVGKDTTFTSSSSSSHDQILSIFPISCRESRSLNIVAVLSDGRRIHYGRRLRLDHNGLHVEVPNTALSAVSIRPPPKAALGGNIENYSSSYHSSGTLILSASSNSSLIVVNREYVTEASRVASIRTDGVHRVWWEESVTRLPVEGRMLCAADAMPPRDTMMILNSLYHGFGESPEKVLLRLRSLKNLELQHILPRRRMIVISTTGMSELVFNRPIDILTSLLLEESSNDSAIQHFFNRFGSIEAAGMCLILAAKIGDNTCPRSNRKEVVDKAREVFENPRFGGVATESLNAGKVVNFSAAFEALRLCIRRLLAAVWHRCVMKCKNCVHLPYCVCEAGRCVLVTRVSVEAMEVLENKLRSLERFLKSLKAQRNGLYARLHLMDSGRGASFFKKISFGKCVRDITVDDVADVEVQATECLRHLLLRFIETLFLLRFLSNHHLPPRRNTPFLNLVFHDEGRLLIKTLISDLLKGNKDDIIGELSKGCPSFYKGRNCMYDWGLEYLDRAAAVYLEDGENLAKIAFNFLKQASLGADLHKICKKFEFLRFYEAVVKLPLLKAQALDPDDGGDTINEQREKCYKIIFVALRNLNEIGLKGYFYGLNPSSRKKYISQIVHHAVSSTDKLFREYLYRTMIDMSLEKELLEHAGPDLELFLQDEIASKLENEVGILKVMQLCKRTMKSTITKL